MARVQKLMTMVVVAISLFSMLPMLFMTFDPHHDGLILVTIKETRNSLISRDPLPFNQYGPAWSLIDTFLTWFVGGNFLMLGLRILTLFLYILTGYLIFRASKRYYGERVAYLALLIFAISQPFVSIYKSGFMAWPSTFISPVLLLIVLFFNRRINSNNFLQVVLNDSLISILTILALFTRAQVGILSLAFLLFLYILFLGIRNFFSFILNFLISASAIGLGASFFVDLRYSILDEFSYGIFHAAKGLGVSFPVFSVVGALFWLIIYLFIRNTKTESLSRNLKNSYVTSFIVIIGFAFTVIILKMRHLDLFAILSTVQRRFWVSLFIAVFISSVYLLFQHLSHATRSQNREFNPEIVLLGFALIGYLQTYPLIDQMHSWWGSVPLCIVLANIIISATNYSNKRRLTTFWPFAAGLLVLNIILVSFSLSRTTVPFTDAQLALVREQPQIQESFSEIAKFLESNLPSGARVQNLCTDSNVFILNRNYRSSSYLTVFWRNFPETPHMRKALESKLGTYIVDCDQVLDSFPKVFRVDKDRLNIEGTFKDIYGRKWVVYKYF